MEFLVILEWIIGGGAYAIFWGWAGWQMRGHNEALARAAAAQAEAAAKDFADKVQAAVNKALGKTS